MTKTKRQPAKLSVSKPKNKASSIRAERVVESDSTYFLKLVVCVLLGTLWLKFSTPLEVQGLHFTGIPIGLLFGLIFISRFEKLQSDRKTWYAVLIVVTIICYFVPAGIVI